MKNIYLLIVVLFKIGLAFPQSDENIIHNIYNEQLTNSPIYDNLRYLSKEIGHRISGSEQLEKAIVYTRDLMNQYQFDSVYLQPVEVSNWQRGNKEIVRFIDSTYLNRNLNCIALGNSVGTTEEGVEGQVIEVQGLNELEKMDESLVNGKIVFLNESMDKTCINTFNAYNKVSIQREQGATKASKKGAIAVIVRSLAINNDDFPRTGYMAYEKGAKKIPAVAISTNDADLLSKLLKEESTIKVYIKLNCQTNPNVHSFNVIGEIIGSQYPDEIIVVGGHLDSWDVGEGAHDDGGGCLQAIEVLRTFKQLKINPKHTLRVVLWNDEENSWGGNITYAEKNKQTNKKHLAALESDMGVFTPIGFNIDTDNQKEFEKIISRKHLFEPYQIYQFKKGHAGADIAPLKKEGTTLIGLITDSQRYHTLHHSENDTFDKVNKRELELGAAAMTSMIYLIDKYSFD